MKFFSWKLWIPVMMVFLVGWGFTGPVTKQAAKMSPPAMEERDFAFKSEESPKGKSLEKRSSPRVYVPSPPAPAPEPTRVRDIFLYGSVFSILVNFINLLERVTKLTRRIW